MKPLPQLTVLALFGGLAFSSLAPHRAWAQAPAIKQQPYTWKNIEIVGGGFVPGIVFHPTAPGIVYARTDIGGLYRLDNTTKRWIPLNDNFGSDDWNLLGAESVALDPTDPNRVYLAAGQYVNSWAGKGAILRSTDQGKTWARTDMPFQMGGNWGGRSMGERLVVNPRKPSQLFFGSRNAGLWKSDDYGTTWSVIEKFPKGDQTDADTRNLGIPFLVFGPDNTLYIAVADRVTGFYQSNDEGKSWKIVPGHPRGFLPHQGKFDSQGILYVTYSDKGGPNSVADGAVWKYDPKTQKWSDITPLRPQVGTENWFGYAGLAVDAKNPGTVMVSTICRWGVGDDIFRTRDGGTTWTSVRDGGKADASASLFVRWDKPDPISTGVGHWIGALAIDPHNPDRAMYGTGATIYGTDNLTVVDRQKAGERNLLWTIRAQGLEETAVQDLISPPTGAHLHSALGDIGGFRHDDFNAAAPRGMRRNPVMASTGSIDFAELAPNIMVRSGASRPPAAITFDAENTWQPLPTTPENTTSQGKILLSADGKIIGYKTKEAAPFVSRDYGKTWSACVGLNKSCNLIADRANPSRFYAYNPTEGTVFYSTNGGASFQMGATGLKNTQTGVMRNPFGQEGDLWLAMGGNGLQYSSDGGKTFRNVAQGIAKVETFGFGKAAPGASYPTLFAVGVVGKQHGVFRSVDKGQSWVRVNDDNHQYGWIGRVVIGDPRVYGRVYLGTNGRGILYADPK